MSFADAQTLAFPSFQTRTLRPRMMRSFGRWSILRLGLVQQRGEQLVKRCLDVSLAMAGLIVLAPLFSLVAILIKATDGGPVLFWQRRVGKQGREFSFPKFRSMVINAESLKDQLLQENDHEDSITFKMKKDPRVTWIGSILRRYSIDELPQLWCVVTGHMSLVGPRPPVPREVALYSLRERRRLEVIPGLTCIWQVRGRGDIPFEEQVELDLEYIQTRGVWLDLKLLLLTLPAIISGRGAY